MQHFTNEYHICDKCKGTGYALNYVGDGDVLGPVVRLGIFKFKLSYEHYTLCRKCQGERVVNWVENIIGKNSHFFLDTTLVKVKIKYNIFNRYSAEPLYIVTTLLQDGINYLKEISLLVVEGFAEPLLVGIEALDKLFDIDEAEDE